MTAPAHSTVIDLLRHGETQGGSGFYGSTDIPLSSRGWTQLNTAVHEEAHRWDRILSSPLRRCADFARELSETLGLPLNLDDRFREMHFGGWEGFTASQLMERDAEALGRFWDDPENNTPPRAEPLAGFRERVLCAWHETIALYPGERLLLVTHGGVIRSILCHVHEHPINRLLEIEVRHAALHRVQALGCGPQLQYRVGSTPL